MASEKTSSKQPRGLEHGQKAAGARYVRKGFGFSPEDDLRFALGWPWIATLTEDHKGDSLELPSKYSPWPANWAPALTRSLALNWFPSTFTKEVLATCNFDSPLGKDEAVKILRERFLESRSAVHTGALLLGIEAQHGPDLVVDTMVEALEGFPKDRKDSFPVDLTAGLFMLGFILLRVPEAKAKDASSRLQRLVDAKNLSLSMTLQLDMILNGRAGVERSAQKEGGKIGKPDLQHVTDDGAFVAKELARWGPPKKHEQPMPRLMFLGGDAALEHEANVWEKYPDKAAIVDDYGDIKSPLVVAMFAKIAHTSKAKAAALAWFEQHREYAAPILHDSAKSSPAAAAVLKKLG